MSDYFNFIETSNNQMDYVKKMREKLNMPKQKPKGEKRRLPVKTKEEADKLRFNTFAGNIDYLSKRGKMTSSESKVKAPNDPSLTGGEKGFVGDFSVQSGPWKGGVEAFHYTPATFFPNQQRGGFKHNIAGTGINPVPPEFKAKASFMDYGKNTEYFAKSGLPQLNEGLPSFEAGIKHWPGRKKDQQPKPYSEMRYGGMVEGDPVKPSKKKKKYYPPLTHRDSVEHQANKTIMYDQLRGRIDGKGLPYYSDPKYKDMLMNDIFPEVNKIMPNATAMEKGEAMDFIFNSGFDQNSKKITKDPRAYALQEYYRKYDPSKLDKNGKWSGRKGSPYSFDSEYKHTIGKLPENERRVFMNKGRDWYAKNTYREKEGWWYGKDNQGNLIKDEYGAVSPGYKNTWYGRIWNTNDFSEFDPNNPKFTPGNQQKVGSNYRYGGVVSKSDKKKKGCGCKDKH